MKKFQNILIVRTDRMGDVVLTTPSIKTLRAAYPKSRISILVSPSTQDLIERNPYLDEIIVDDLKGVHKGLRGFLKLIYFLRRKQYDLAIIFHTKKRTNLMCFLSGISYRIGYKNNKFGFLLTHPIFDTRLEGLKHESQYCLDVLNELGVASSDSELELYVTVDDASQQWVEQWAGQKKIDRKDCLIAIHPSASDPSKMWSNHYFAELIDKMRVSRKCKIVMIGARDIHNGSREILKLIASQEDVFDLTGKTTVSQLVSVLKRCDLLISNDSGPGHVAAALKIPVVSLFTRNQPGINYQRWRPLGTNSRVVSVPVNNQISFAKSGFKEPMNVETLKFQDVWEAVDAVFKLC